MNWDVSKEEAELIEQITDRVFKSASGGVMKRLDVVMDLTACHANGCRLRLADLLAAPDIDFAHDIKWILHLIDRKTGKLGRDFVPRYAEVQ